MKRRPHTKRRFSVGEIVDMAYAEASRLTSDPRTAAVITSKLVEALLSASDRPDLVDQLRAAS